MQFYSIQELSSNESPHVVFGPSCYHHGLLESTQYWNKVTVNGGNVTAQSQLLSWLKSERLDGVSVCNGVNCEKSCPHVDISNAATECIKSNFKENFNL